MFSLFADAVYGPLLNKLLNLTDSMPSEPFLKLLARKTTASRNDVERASGSGPVNDFPHVDSVLNVVEKSSGLVKEKNKEASRGWKLSAS